MMRYNLAVHNREYIYGICPQYSPLYRVEFRFLKIKLEFQK